MKHADHAAHFAKAPPAVRERLEAIQAAVEARVPGAERHVGYGMPAFRMGATGKGKVFFYFGAFKSHIGVYPPASGPADLVARLAAYRGPKGNLSFPHDEPLPLALIGEAAEALAGQYGG